MMKMIPTLHIDQVNRSKVPIAGLVILHPTPDVIEIEIYRLAARVILES